MRQTKEIKTTHTVTTIHCDVCGKKFDKEDKKVQTPSIAFHYNSHTDKYTQVETYYFPRERDLCKRCTMALQTFLFKKFEDLEKECDALEVLTKCAELYGDD